MQTGSASALGGRGGVGVDGGGGGGGMLRELDLTGASRVDDLALLTLLKSCHNLHNLSLRWCGKLTDAGVAAAIQEAGRQAERCVKHNDQDSP